MTDEFRHLRYWAKTAPESDEGYHPVLYHCLDVAAVGLTLLETRPSWLDRLARVSTLPPESVLAWVPFLLSLHDLGKMANGFQKMAPDLMQRLQGRVRHATYDAGIWRHDTIGFAALDRRIFDDGLQGIVDPSSRFSRKRFAQTWLSATMGHHGVPPTTTNQHALDWSQQFDPEIDRDFDNAITELRTLFLTGDAMFPTDAPKGALEASSWLVAGLAVTADWIGSSQHWFPATVDARSARSYFDDIAREQAAKAVVETGMQDQPRTSQQAFIDLWPGFDPTPLQCLADELALDSGPQLIVIEEVTGGGKTEAAFTLAHRLMAGGQADGLYVGLPTMATANAMYERLRGPHRTLFAEGAEPSLVLAHGRRREHLSMRLDAAAEGAFADPVSQRADERAGTECAAWLADHRKKSLLADVGIGTIDQALLGILEARHQSLRLWGLAGKVLAVDEVHAADPYMRRLLERLLEAHATFGGSAVVLSATLATEQRQRLIDAFARGAGFEATPADDNAYPALVHVSSNGCVVHPLKARTSASRMLDVTLLHDTDAADGVLAQTLDAGGCACWIRNTVPDAMEAWDRWRARLGDERVHLFHARFAVGDRAIIEDDVLRRFGKRSGRDQRRGHLLIATQVVEQSLDLDFDCLVTDLAPVDLMIQRAGRLRRHSRNLEGDRVVGTDQRGQPTLHIVAPPPEPDCDTAWYRKIFPGGARVYTDHGRLWLGARWLVERGRISIPDDLRELIEHVYEGAAFERVPPALEDATLRNEGDALADQSTAEANGIELAHGYRPSLENSNWRDDISTPTRLSDPTTTLRLAREGADGHLVPWQSEGPFRWQRSEVSIRTSQVAGEHPADVRIIEEAKAIMPGKGRFCTVVILRPAPAGQWNGQALDERKRPCLVTYDRRRGLAVGLK